MSSQPHLDVFVAPYKPIVGLIPPMSEGKATWPATSVSLISGERDAVLIDALIVTDEAKRSTSINMAFSRDTITTWMFPEELPLRTMCRSSENSLES